MTTKNGKKKAVERRLVLVSIPPEIKQKAAENVESGLSANMNDELVGTLAARFKVKFDPTGRRGAPANTDSDAKILLRMPPRLKAKIAREALNRESNLRTQICQVLADEYGLAFEPRGARSVPFGGGR